MALDFATLLNALSGAEKTAQAESPYKPLGDTADAIGQLVLQDAQKNPEKTSFKDGLVKGLISGLVSGGMQNLTDRYAQKQTDLAGDVLAQAFAGGDVFRPEGMNRSVFGNVKNTGTLFRLQNAIANQEAYRDSQLKSQLSAQEAGQALKNTIAGKAVEGMIDNPYKASRAEGILSQLFGGSAAPIAEPSPAASVDPKYEEYLNKYAGDEALARAAMQRDMELPQKKEGTLQDLRKEFSALPEVKSYTLSDIGIRSLRKAIADPSATSDLELVRGAIQAIEPGMAVREGEQAAVSASGSIPEQWKGWLSKSLAGESSLPPEVRNGILRIAERRYSEYADKFNAARSFYSSQAERQKLPTSEITYLPEAATTPAQPTAAVPQSSPAPMVGESAATIFPAPGMMVKGGITYQKVPGGWQKVK